MLIIFASWVRVWLFLYRLRSRLFSSPCYGEKPELAKIQNDWRVIGELRRAWFESNPYAKEVPAGEPGSSKREQGGWIVWNTETGELVIIRVAPGSRDQLRTISGTRPSDDERQQVVAWFHTHPNTEAEGYSSEPSPTDMAFTRFIARVPGIIETHDGQKIISTS